LTIANRYLHGEVGAETAAKQLTTKGPFGKLLAGEVLLDRMTTSPASFASTYSTRARQQYNGVVEQTKSGQWKDGYDHAGSRIRAQMRLAQLTALETLYSKRKLPAERSAEVMYNRLLSLGRTAIDSRHGRPLSKVDSAIEERGMLNELAVLLLAQRFAIREVGSDEWFPFQSSFSEDTAGDCLERRPDDYTWDLNVFTRPVQGSIPDKTYTLQIRQSNYRKTGPPTGPTLYVNPDLILKPDERGVSEKIITACAFEADDPLGAARLSQELDARTEKLLTVLES